MIQEPEITRRDPKAYYYWLQQNGIPQMQAIQMVDGRFGGGKTPQQAAKDEAKAQQTGALAQTGGAIGGLLAGKYVMDNAGKLWDKITGKPVPTDTTTTPTVTTPATPSVPTPTNVGATRVSAGSASPNVIAKGAPVPAGFTPVGTSADGGVIIAPTDAAANLPSEVLKDTSFLENVNWGKLAQGGLGAVQLYGAYNAYKSGDKLGAGLGGATGAANLAAAGGSQLAGNVVPGLNIATGAYGGYQTAKMIGDAPAGAKRNRQSAAGGAAAGASIGAGVDVLTGGATLGLGTALGAVIGGTAGLVGSLTGSKKGGAQMMRDSIRKNLKKAGVINENYEGTLADGTVYNFGRDGSNKWKDFDKLAAANPNSWSEAVRLGNALAASYGLTGQKNSDITAWYSKAAVSNAQDNPEVAKQNMRHFAQSQGITFDRVKENLDKALKDEKITEQRYNEILAAATDLTGGAQAQPAQQQAVPVARPAAGQVARQSPGMYRDDEGNLIKARSMRQALERAYGRTKKGK